VKVRGTLGSDGIAKLLIVSVRPVGPAEATTVTGAGVGATGGVVVIVGPLAAGALGPLLFNGIEVMLISTGVFTFDWLPVCALASCVSAIITNTNIGTINNIFFICLEFSFYLKLFS
jgi:hypothetical protein